jgi:hypothetical protein
MAFTSRNDIPAFLKDEVTGKTYQVWNGDNYDARFLDPKREDGVGMIVGLTNKDRTGKPEDAALKNDGFFVDYNPERDGETLIIKDQDKLAGKKPEPKAFPIKVSAEITKSPQRFYSALAKGIDGIQTKAAPAAGWKDAIKGLVNKGAAKADEVEWSGINDWLDLQEGRVAKEQVTTYLRENGVQVIENQFGDRDETTAAMVDRYEYLENEALDRDLTSAEEREFEGLQKANEAERESRRIGKEKENLQAFQKTIKALPEREELKKAEDKLGQPFAPTQDNFQDLATMFSLVGVLGFAIGAGGKGNSIAAMNAMNGMMEGHQQGRQDKYQREKAIFDENTKALKIKIDALSRRMTEISKIAQTDMEAANMEADMLFAKEGADFLKQYKDKFGLTSTIAEPNVGISAITLCSFRVCSISSSVTLFVILLSLCL